MDKKTCKDCGIEKPAYEFYANPRTKLGLSTYCKECTTARNLKWQRENPEVKKAYNKKYKSEHRKGQENIIEKRIRQKQNKVAKLLSEIVVLKSQLRHLTSFAADTRHAPDGGGASDNQGQG